MPTSLGVSKGAAKGKVENHLGVTTDAAFYFDNLLEVTEEDGKAFGEQLMLKMKERGIGGSKQEAAKAFVKENKAFMELVIRHKFMEGLLYAVL